MTTVGLNDGRGLNDDCGAGEFFKGYVRVFCCWWRVVGDSMGVAVLRDPCSGLAIRKSFFEA
jgi:hypothetical protein